MQRTATVGSTSISERGLPRRKVKKKKGEIEDHNY